MARPYRIQIEDGFYHIISRGNDSKNIYRSKHDYVKFLEYLTTAKEKFRFYVHAYCLMPNHYHLFIETTQANLSRIMQYLNSAYTMYHNVKYGKTGHLFQGRYKSILVEQDAYFTELTRYVHMNPVKAKIVKSPVDYHWSSYEAYIRGKSDGCVDICRLKEYLSMSLKEYRKFVEETENHRDPFKDVYAGFILGRDKFIKDKLNLLRIDVESKDFAHKRELENIIDPHEIINVVGKHYKISPAVITSGVSRPMTAKKMAIYLLRKKTDLTNTRIGRIFNMTPGAVSMAALGLEREMRDNRELKRSLDKLVCSFRV